MDVFISWSGQRSKIVAEALRLWLGDVLQNVTPWLSSEDIDPGTRWNSELAGQLEKTHFGVICLTPESIRAPWILFEAGALAKALGSSRVCPYLIQMDTCDLKLPLAQFDAVNSTKSGTLKLVRSINHAMDSKEALPEDRLIKYFDKWWPELEQKLNNIPPIHTISDALPTELESLGIKGIFRSRSDALMHFGTDLRSEINKGSNLHKFVYVVSTSMRGFLATDAQDFHGLRILEELIKNKIISKFLLTEPEVAERRAKQESRPPRAIAGEVKSTVSQLLNLGITLDQIRYYEGSPTVFGIATSKSMLLNPYPNENESHRCMTIIVQKTDNKSDIYHQYLESHFDKPWANAKRIEPSTLLNQ
jgi:hypothetical protein